MAIDSVRFYTEFERESWWPGRAPRNTHTQLQHINVEWKKEQVMSANHLARGSMKNAVNCVNKHELQILWVPCCRLHIAPLGFALRHTLLRVFSRKRTYNCFIAIVLYIQCAVPKGPSCIRWIGDKILSYTCHTESASTCWAVPTLYMPNNPSVRGAFVPLDYWSVRSEYTLTGACGTTVAGIGSVSYIYLVL